VWCGLVSCSNRVGCCRYEPELEVGSIGCGSLLIVAYVVLSVPSVDSLSELLVDSSMTMGSSEVSPCASTSISARGGLAATLASGMALVGGMAASCAPRPINHSCISGGMMLSV